MKYLYFYDCELGKIGIEENGQAITHVYFDGEKVLADEKAIEEETPLLKRAGEQLAEYLSGKRRDFDLPLDAKGTEFMQSVWAGLCDIPYGKTCTYGEIAEVIGNPKACRAVGLANNRNPIPIFIPCHRVIGANGKLVGYGGGLNIKEYLLALEKKVQSV
ncbi:methylated-DNA--[protein]-cysteine S-methyltransferase [Bacillus sp. 1P06AnD]|uniref:methylated-DNA--[protein]-cysteine S-methyltransferase n=1 Tax=Bacillus sp. 1P06AnD TaxID=3132208 RepID=UPI00399FF12D